MLRIQTDCHNIPWADVTELKLKVDTGAYTPEMHRIAFENSYKVVFVFNGEKLVGCGRLLSDRSYQAAMYDVALDETYQGEGLGEAIINTLMEDNTDTMNIILYAVPGKESFYEKFGFRLCKTAMIRFTNPELKEEEGLI